MFRRLPEGLAPPARTLTQQGINLFRKGQVAKAAEQLEKAAALAEQQELFTWAFNARYYLALATVSNNPLRAYQNLLMAINAQEQILTRIGTQSSCRCRRYL